MTAHDNPALVDTGWLAKHLDAPDVRVVDASYYLPNEGLDPRAEYEVQHIPGAVFFDIDDIADSDSSLPHMLPSPEKFSSKAQSASKRRPMTSLMVRRPSPALPLSFASSGLVKASAGSSNPFRSPGTRPCVAKLITR